MIPRDILIQGVAALGLECSDAQADAFMTYLAQLKKWNRAYSLTSIRDDRDIIQKHFLDSLLYLKALPKNARSIADIGAGAGFPGIPLKLMLPDIMLYLIEPVQKKAAFLRHTVRLLALDGVEVINQRVEDVRDIQVDAALTRALFDVHDFHLKARHVVSPGGVLVLSKGPKVHDELSKVSFSCEMVEAELPGTNTTRYLVIIPL